MAWGIRVIIFVLVSVAFLDVIFLAAIFPILLIGAVAGLMDEIFLDE